MRLSPTILLTMSFCLLGGLLETAKAAVVVNWGGDMVTSNRSLALPSPADTSTSTRTWAWTENSNRISPGTADYSTHPPFWGALQTQTGNSTYGNLSVARITQDGTNDYLQLWGTATAGTNVSTGLIHFKPSVSEGASVSFNETGSLKINIKTFTGSDRILRFAVLNNGVWYLSQTHVTGIPTGNVFEISNPAGVMWGAWSGVDGASPLPSVPTTFGIAGTDFTNIQAIGFYFSVSNTNAAGRLEISSFNVEASVVPEPSAAVTLLMSGAGFLIFLKARRTRCFATSKAA